MLLSVETIEAPTQSRLNWAIGAIVALIVAKLFFAALLPLSGDEFLYWMYSRHLAPGFIDHPFMNPLMIRVGTTLLGNTPLGVRVMAVLLSVPATWAVWRSATILSGNASVGLQAAILFNLMTAISIGSLAATSDMLVILTSSFLLYFLAKLQQSGRGYWWLAAGAAFGLGMDSKYTTAFFAVSILAWLVLVPANRKWILNPWSFAGGVVALALFSPVVLWNADNHWASFGYQSHRMTIQHWSLRYVAELIGSQFLLITPPIFILGCFGLSFVGHARQEPRSSLILLGALVVPIATYFLWHSLHERVQGNWPEPAYPAFAIAAAFSTQVFRLRSGFSGTVVRWCRRLAAPVGVAIAASAVLQGAFGIVSLGHKDPTARVLAVGWTPLATSIDELRRTANIPAYVTTDYTLAGWLSFYLPSKTPVIQLNERVRWVNAPQPSDAILAGPLLYVCKDACPYIPYLKRGFDHVDLLGAFRRERNGALINIYSAYRLSGPIGPVLDPIYPPMNLGRRND